MNVEDYIVCFYGNYLIDRLVLVEFLDMFVGNYVVYFKVIVECDISVLLIEEVVK